MNVPQWYCQGDILRGVLHLEDIHNDYGSCQAGEVASECAAANKRKSGRNYRCKIIHYGVEVYLNRNLFRKEFFPLHIVNEL